MLWEPAIYEHKAALIDKTPWEVAHSASLLVRALEREHQVYGADLLTVGVDVYNVEAEACGAALVRTDSRSCPEIAGPILDLETLPSELPLPAIPGSGRFGMLLEAGVEAVKRLDGRARVRVAASGPVSIAAKLAGIEALVVSLAVDDGAAARLLDHATRIAELWCAVLRDSGLEVILFDSSCAPPVFSPGMYRAAVAPLHERLMTLLAASGQRDRPLIVGGNTAEVAADLQRTGASMLICDFTVDPATFADALRSPEPRIRLNLDPSLITAASPRWEEIVPRYVAGLRCFANPAGGTGILPFDTDAKHYRSFRRQVENALLQ